MNIKKFLNKTLDLPEAAWMAYEALRDTEIGKFIKKSPDFFLLNKENIIAYFIYSLEENDVPFYGKDPLSDKYKIVIGDYHYNLRISYLGFGLYNFTQSNGKPLYEDIRVKHKDVKKYIKRQKLRLFFRHLLILLNRLKRATPE